MLFFGIFPHIIFVIKHITIFFTTIFTYCFTCTRSLSAVTVFRDCMHIIVIAYFSMRIVSITYPFAIVMWKRWAYLCSRVMFFTFLTIARCCFRPVIFTICVIIIQVFYKFMTQNFTIFKSSNSLFLTHTRVIVYCFFNTRSITLLIFSCGYLLIILMHMDRFL